MNDPTELTSVDSTTAATAVPVSPINTNVRLFDLVRYMRSELHAADLITDEEFTWLCADAPMANSDAGGSPSPRRLEDYDELRDKIAFLKLRALGAIEAASKYAAAGNYEEAALVRQDFADKGTIEVFEKMRAKANEVEALRAKLVSAHAAMRFAADNIGRDPQAAWHRLQIATR